MSRINVDKEKSNDVFYRYKMTKVALKNEGNGNGLRTVFLNLDLISTEIHRPPIILITYISSIIGCKFVMGEETNMRKEDNTQTKWILYGKFSEEQIQNCVYEFINIFVLCKHCRNPETEFDDSAMKCAACSKKTEPVFNKHTMKVMKLIIKIAKETTEPKEN